MNEPPPHLCPVCHQPLNTEEFKSTSTSNYVWCVWCGHGPCPSLRANDGSYGTTLDIAVKTLEAAVEAEQEAKKSQDIP